MEKIFFFLGTRIKSEKLSAKVHMKKNNILSPKTNNTYVGGQNLKIEGKPLKNIHPCAMCISSLIQTLTRQGGSHLFANFRHAFFPCVTKLK